MFFYKGWALKKKKRNDGGEHWDNQRMLNGRAGMDGGIAAANRRQRPSPSPGDDGGPWCCSPHQAQVRDPRLCFSSVAPDMQGNRAGCSCNRCKDYHSGFGQRVPPRLMVFYETDRQAERHTGRSTGKQIYRETGRQISRQAERHTDRQTERQAERQAERHIDGHT